MPLSVYATNCLSRCDARAFSHASGCKGVEGLKVAGPTPVAVASSLRIKVCHVAIVPVNHVANPYERAREERLG